MLKRTTLAAALMLATTLTYAEPASEPPAVSKQMRRDMADMLEKATACLRSDRAYEECATLIAMTHAGMARTGMQHSGMDSMHCSMMDGMAKPAGPEGAHQHDH